MGLKEYKAKRNFGRTREPRGREQPRSKRRHAPLFVIQKHAARRLHFDFRLEMDGVLKSWAIPKGLPLRKRERHLAVHVEDHPLDYRDFEGTIAPGNYGAGTVMVWDNGTYEVQGDEPLAALRSGKLHLTLHGAKSKGDWILVRMRGRENKEGNEQWLVLKGGDDATISTRVINKSVLTQRTMEQIAEQNDRQWQSNHPSEHARPKLPPLRDSRRVASRKKPVGGGREFAKLPKARAEFIQPMKALLKDELPRGENWIYELKFDGVRALAIKNRKSVSLLSRNEKDFTKRFPQLADAVGRLPATEAVLDGEVVALDEQGRPSFQVLQSHDMPGRKPPLFYYVFDLLQLNGRDLTGLPLERRKAIAEELVRDVDEALRFSATLKAKPERLIREVKARGLEGLIAKRADSLYQPGRRSGAWVKYKWTNEQEFVIGGYTEPKGARKFFGAILVGYYERGKLIFASKVGSGFNHELLTSLHEKFQKLDRSTLPFVNLPTKRGASGSQNLSAAEMRRCSWIKPELVCQVRFSEWTRDGGLRQPVFLGLREDKQPEDVRREIPK